MTSRRCFHVDAFADRPFTGNQAVVCLVPAMPTTALMQQVAAEFGLVTAFLAAASDAPALRTGVTPFMESMIEMDLGRC